MSVADETPKTRHKGHKMKLPTALSGVGNGGTSVFRGVNHESKISGYQFWATDRAYAAKYGDIVFEAEVCAHAQILDLRTCLTEDGDYDGAKINEICPGLAEAMGIDGETTVGRDQLWDCCCGDHASAVELVRAAGFAGWVWFEGEGNDEAYCLLVQA